MMQAIHTLKQGYAPLYRTGDACPGCHKMHWAIGRFSAECVACGTAIPFAPTEGAPASPYYPGWSDRP